MNQLKPDINEIARVITSWFPPLTKEEQSISLRLYRMLATGAPVALEAVANSLNISFDTVKSIMQKWPGVYYDDDGMVQGYWGLAIQKMGHRFEVDGKTLYGWCAWDTLFMPELIGKSAMVESTCPVTKKTISLTATPSRIENAKPDDIAVTFLLPDASKDIENVQASFCHYVYFFSSGDAADEWIAEHPETFRLSINEAFELGKIKNKIQYGDALNEK